MRTGRITILLLLFISLFSVADMNAQSSPAKPDFAYPKTVSENAGKELQAALAADDGPGITRALMDYYLARTSIDAANSNEAIMRIDSVADSATDPVLKAMLTILRADIYSAIYNSSRWKYDSRELPLTPLPADVNEWSGEQFRAKINTLTGLALSYKSALQATPISAYSSVIDLAGSNGQGNKPYGTTRLTEIYYPTLYDFVAYQSIDLLLSNGRVEPVLPPGLLTGHSIYVTLPFTKYDPTASKILETYASLLQFHEPGSAPFINSELRRIDFITSHIYTDTPASDNSLAERKFSLLQSLYDENFRSEYSGDILLDITNDGDAQRTWLYDAINHNLKEFPAYPRRNSLSNLRLNLEEQSVSLSYPDIVAPGTPLKFKINAKNVRNGKIYIYDVSSSPITEISYNCKGLPPTKALAVIPFTAGDDVKVPFNKEISVDHTFAKAGNYIAIATIDGVPLTDRRWYDKINVTRYVLAASQFERSTIWAIDAATGSPVGNAVISLNDSRTSANTLKAIGKTDKDGALNVTSSGSVFMDKNGDRFTPSVWINGRSRTLSESDWRKAASGYASLAIYHPADSVDWMAIVYEYKGNAHRPLIAEDVKAILRDASRNAIDTLNLTTDEFGRIAGCFRIPQDCLSGRFTISIDKYADPVSFMVSDYKLPTFKVILDPVERDTPTVGAVTLHGHIETYAGFPVSDAQLTIAVEASSRSRWWWSRQSGVKFYTLTAQSDSKGMIKVEIPTDVLAMSPIPDGIFSIKVTAISPSGETQTASTSFSNGTRYLIRTSVPENIDITTPTTAITAKVLNYMDSAVMLPVNYTIYREDRRVMSGSLSSKSGPIDLTPLASGKYQICFSLADDTLADSVKNDVIFYRPTDTASPCPDKLLWYPHNKLTVTSGNKAEWLYAVDCNTNLLVTIHTDTEIIDRKWIPAEIGMHRLPVSLPDSIEKAVMDISLTGNYRTAYARIDISADRKDRGLRFITESFRNRLVPGNEETWTFRVVDETDCGQKSAVILDMYNSALDALAVQSWKFNPISRDSRYYFNWNQTSFTGRGQNSVNHIPGKYLRTIDLRQPDFNTYGLSLSPRQIYFGHSRKLMSKAARVDNLNAVNEHSDEIAVEEAFAESGAMDAGVAMNAMATADYATAGMVNDEEEVATVADDATSSNEPVFSYRDRETALAFFRPLITTDADGRLSFTFTVPNANTTWTFNAIAYTDSLLSTNFTADVIASKPVMVKPNLPRYARAGDKVFIPASVMNNSDAEQSIDTKVEIFDVTDGHVVESRTYSNNVPAKSSMVVTTEITAPTDASVIGYRIKSSTRHFADGEQTLLAILPAVSPVIDTYPFYISPDEKDFSMHLPKVPAGTHATLQFCDNPIWYIVTALPGIIDTEATTANEAAASIFSTAVAAGIIHDNPMIATALKEWAEGDKDNRTLTSMLEQNEDLKQMLLAATPWMTDAKNDTERMTRLALLFDNKTINATLKANIATLRKLVRGNGGLAWNAYGNEASEWATENVLMLMGQLTTLGYMPDSQELTLMVNNALKWIDVKAKDSYHKHPKSDFTRYVYLRDNFKDFKGAPPAITSIVNSTVQRILADWKSASVFNKGIYAQILAQNSYATVARTILESLREYSDYTPVKGMWWPSLDNLALWSMDKVGTTAMLLETFTLIEPQSQDIDRIRQWLILQKESNEWGTSVTTSNVIAAILSTSPKWVEPAKDMSVSVAGKQLKIDKTDRFTGYFRTPLMLDSNSKSELKVSRTGDSPSWGALYYLYTDSITSVKAHSCPELSIDKKFSTAGNYADSFTVGDKVSVTLTIHAENDMDYVTIVDERPACFEPVEQLPTPIYAEGICFYRENRDSSTRIFIDRLPKGTYVITYDMWVNNAGTFASGVATIQSQYAPQFTAHTAGTTVNVAE